MKYAIIGAGIGGLTTALAFEKLGINYRIYERAEQLNEVGAGIWLAPNALQVLEWLGLYGAVRKAGNSIDRVTISRSDLSPISDNDQSVFKDHFGYSTIAIHRARLQQLLFDQLPSNKVRLGKAFMNSIPVDSGGLRMEFEDGTSEHTDYIIGADGIHSVVRAHLFPDSQKRYSGQTCWRGIADYALPESFQHRGIELWGPKNRIGFSPIAEGQVYWFAVANSIAEQKQSGTESKSQLIANYQDYASLIQEMIQATQPGKILKNDIYDLAPMKDWFLDPICLIGDAAHATTPNMGQGGAQAIEDAYYLSNCIVKYGVGAFPKFQAFRQKKVNQVVQQSWRTGKMAHWTKGQGLRNFLISKVPKSFLHKQMMQLYSIDRSWM